MTLPHVSLALIACVGIFTAIYLARIAIDMARGRALHHSPYAPLGLVVAMALCCPAANSGGVSILLLPFA